MTNERLTLSGADIAFSSPDGAFRIALEWLDEVHFGPAYFALWMQRTATVPSDEFVGPGRSVHYGGRHAFSADGRFLVLEKWSSLAAPDNTIVLLDLLRGLEADLLHVASAFLCTADFAELDGQPVCVLTLDVFDGKYWTQQCKSQSMPAAAKWTIPSWWPAGCQSGT